MKSLPQAIVSVITTAAIVALGFLLVAFWLASALWRVTKRAAGGSRPVRLVADASAFVVLSAVVTAALWLRSPFDMPSQSLTFRIESRASLSSVAHRLAGSHVLDRPRWFSAWGRALGVETRMRAGRYRVDPGMTPLDLLIALRSGSSLLVSVTVPEGAMMYEIAGIWARSTDCDSAGFVALGETHAFVRGLGIDAPSLEGFLFPETYSVDEAVTERDAIELMADEFKRRTGDDYEARANRQGLTLIEAVTLASLVEWETPVPEERPLVSAVYWNRLRKGMLLQCDPTVIYALRPLDRPLRKRDLSVDSPYNTYRYSGLPPGPICSPGEASLEAALAPADAGYLYFVASGDGGHLFAYSNAEHEANKRRVRRGR